MALWPRDTADYFRGGFGKGHTDSEGAGLYGLRVLATFTTPIIHSSIPTERIVLRARVCKYPKEITEDLKCILLLGESVYGNDCYSYILVKDS